MILELATQSRSYRGFDRTRKVTDAELEYLVKCARVAPSSVNMQPLKFLPANTDPLVSAIQPCTAWARGLPQMQLPHPGKEPTAFVVICQDTQIHSDLGRFQRDLGIVAQTMLLAATELGLGGCMIANFRAGELKNALSLPERYVPLMVVALGKPDETVVLTDVDETGSTAYYRDEHDTHYVPKRSVDDLILKL